MGTITATAIQHSSTARHRPMPAAPARPTPLHLLALLLLWGTIFLGGLAGPALLDDADATHAQAAQSMLRDGDWVTLHVDGVRYLEKAPLPYWIAAASLRLFPAHRAFAIHLPLALTVLGLALLGYRWSKRAFGERAALLTGIFLLTSAGVFLFTRIFIPDALLSLLLALALYTFLGSLEGTSNSALSAYAMWLSLSLAVLTKGLVAVVFFLGTAVLFLAVMGEPGRWRRLRPVSGVLLFLAVAAPWHLLAGIRNEGPAGGHGFFWFYFINEHVLRYLGRRIPRDYNKLPTLLYWLSHLVWLFPWSLFAPAAIALGVRRFRGRSPESMGSYAFRTAVLLLLFSAVVLLFFSFSTNQEYYTFPVYLPLLMLLAAALAGLQQRSFELPRFLASFGYVAFCVLGLAITVALGYGLWTARHLPYVADIGALLAHRGVGDYTLSMSHFFDLTGPSFAALRLPAAMAALAFAMGPPAAWLLHARRHEMAALVCVALTGTLFLAAAHIALLRFEPMLSSVDFARRIQSLEASHSIAPETQILLFGDQAFGSSFPFYLDRQVYLVDGRSTSMLFGSTFPDAPPVFLTDQQLLSGWGAGPRKILFVPAELRPQVDQLLGSRKLLLQQTSGKALYTDRPLDSGPVPVSSTNPYTQKAALP